MSTVDYEAAWRDLQREVAAVRQGIGAGRLLELMARVEARHPVDEHALVRTLRVYGTRLQEALAAARDESLTQTREDQPSPVAEAEPPDRMAPAPAHRPAEGGHDGSQHRRGRSPALT